MLMIPWGSEDCKRPLFVAPPKSVVTPKSRTELKITITITFILFSVSNVDMAGVNIIRWKMSQATFDYYESSAQNAQRFGWGIGHSESTYH